MGLGSKILASADPVVRMVSESATGRIMTLLRRVTGVSGFSAGAGLRATVSLPLDEEHDDVEVMEPYGFASQPPDGMDGLLACVGGDSGHAVLLSAGQQTLRIEGLASGDVAIYVGTEAGDGARVVCRAAGGIEIECEVGSEVRLGLPSPAPAAAVARLGDAITLRTEDQAALAALVTAWNAALPGGGPLLVPAGPALAPPTGAGSITSGGTGVVST